MSYTKNTWASGDVITAEKLNNMEEGVQEALECCDGGGSAGYSCVDAEVALIDETVTTTLDYEWHMASLAYQGPLDYDSLTITFDGVDYECEFNGFGYGAPFSTETESFDWSEYQFALMVGHPNSLVTPADGTYTLKVNVVQETIVTTPCFEKAVNEVVDGVVLVKITETMSGGQSVYTLDRTKRKVLDVYRSGKLPVLVLESSSNYEKRGIYYPQDFTVFNNNLVAIGYSTSARVYSIDDEGDTLYMLSQATCSLGDADSFDVIISVYNKML